jgi:voltage-gated potassium channel Kch
MIPQDDIPLDDLKAERHKIQIQSRLLGLISLLMLLVGATFFHIVERLNWVNAFYFCTMTLTTVGYGDIVPKTNAGKIFDIFYVLAGIGIIAALANILVKNAIIRRHLRLAKKKSLI